MIVTIVVYAYCKLLNKTMADPSGYILGWFAAFVGMIGFGSFAGKSALVLFYLLNSCVVIILIHLESECFIWPLCIFI